MKQLVPQNDRVLIKPIQEHDLMYGNIIVPDMGKEKGEIIAVGKGRMSEFGAFIPVNSRVGDVVLVPKIGSIRVDFDGEEYYITPDKEILATVKETENA